MSVHEIGRGLGATRLLHFRDLKEVVETYYRPETGLHAFFSQIFCLFFSDAEAGHAEEEEGRAAADV